MSEHDQPATPKRRRPSYGLPGPTEPQVEPREDASSAVPYGSPASAPNTGQTASAHPESAPGWGAPGLTAPSTTAPTEGVPTGAPGGNAPRKRRGVWPLIIGLVLLLIVGPALGIGSVLFSMREVVSAASSGPIEVPADGLEIELAANEMVFLYVPQADAASAQCTGTAADDGQITTVAASGAVDLPQGAYEQKAGVVALQDTKVTITCDGVSKGPALYIGPVSLASMGITLLVGLLGALALGLVGLILTVVGIVKLVRSRR